MSPHHIACNSHGIRGGLLAAALLMSASASGFSGSNSVTPPEREAPLPPSQHGIADLRILNYNVHALPGALGGGKDNRKRLRQIGRLLAEQRAAGTAPHLVAIQEGFNELTEQLVSAAGYPYRAYGPGKKGLRTSSGLIILSEYPIRQVFSEVYNDCVSFDCWSRKGIMAAEIEIPDLPVPLMFFNTHLNSDPDGDPTVSKKKTQEIRIRQIAQLRRFVDATSTHWTPVLIGADFNVRVGTPDYLAILLASAWSDGVESCIRQSGCTGDPHPEEYWKQTLDFQFYQSAIFLDSQILMKPDHFETQFEEDYRGEPLSDHLGLKMHYQLSW